jgi:hypothetical protein
MSERKDALIELLAKVEAGEVLQAYEASDVWPTSYDKESGANRLPWLDACNASQGSLDAAKALHEAVLHERVTKYEVWSMRYGGSVELRDGSDVLGAGTDAESNPARAWLIAILKALIAEAAL